MNCQEAKSLTFPYVKGEMDEGARADLRAHLDACETCRKEFEDVQAVLSLVESASDERIIDLVDGIIRDAVNSSASDIHFEPEPTGIRVRARRYGVLHEVTRLPAEVRASVEARIKLMAGMNVSERSVPQDGLFVQNPGTDQELTLRVSCTPAIHGESFVVHPVDNSGRLLGLDKLGISPEQLSRIRALTQRRKGFVVAAGPAGSGVTTLLCSMLAEVNSEELKLVTIEDPVEYVLKGVTQIPVHTKAGVTFATGLRSILRHDPDVIMAGAITSRESGQLAIQATLAGKFVLSALLTDDAPSALIRLLDIGLEPFLVSAAVSGVIAQRLVRRVCDDCREEYTPSQEALGAVGFSRQQIGGTTFHHGKGCEKCSGRGYVGRTPLTEVLTMNREIARLIVARASLDEIRECALSGGMVTMAADARRKIAAGITTAEEAARVLGPDPIAW